LYDDSPSCQQPRFRQQAKYFLLSKTHLASLRQGHSYLSSKANAEVGDIKLFCCNLCCSSGSLV